MSRVSEQSAIHSVNHSVGKTKTKLEDLQIKGSNLKRMQKPSDDPIANVELLSIRSQRVDSGQFLRNSNYAQTLLQYTETAVEELTDIVSKAKEIAIGQASDIYNPEVRQSIAKEIAQLRTQAISIGNRRIGNRYIFGGYKTLTKPFDMNGKYYGDDAKIKLEVNKDFFIPINFNGLEVFFNSKDTKMAPIHSSPIDSQQLQLEEIPENEPVTPYRELASQNGIKDKSESVTNLFDDLRSLENALLTNNPDIVQNLLDRLDENHDRLVKLRTEVGALSNSISNSENAIENKNLLDDAYKSRLEDADIAELFSEINKQQNVLKATYKSTAGLLNQSLLDFVR